METVSSNIHISTESMASKASYVANAGAFTVGAFTLNEILMAIATIFGVATFFVNWHFQKKRNERERARERRENELHQLRMAQPSHRPEDSDG